MSNWIAEKGEAWVPFASNFSPVSKHFEVDDVGTIRRIGVDPDRERRRQASRDIDDIEEVTVEPGRFAFKRSVLAAERAAADEVVSSDLLLDGKIVPRAERLAELVEQHRAATVDPADEAMVECLDRPDWGILSSGDAARRMNNMSRVRMLRRIDSHLFVRGLRFVRAGRPWRGAASCDAGAQVAVKHRGVKVVRVDPDTLHDVGEPYETMVLAAQAVGRTPCAINQAINFGRLAGGWRWRRMGRDLVQPAATNRGHPRQQVEYALAG